MLDSNTRLVLTNAIYYKDVWETAFKENDTEDGSFYVTPTQTVTVPIMHLRETCFRIGYLEELDAQWVALPFQVSVLKFRCRWALTGEESRHHALPMTLAND
jgi:serpin B